MWRALLLAIAFCAMPTASHALWGCIRPRPPSCAGLLMPSSPAWEFEFCRDQLTRFREDIRRYADCLQQDLQQLIDDLNRETRRFNDCARDRFC
jgi:hypothetical protein